MDFESVAKVVYLIAAVLFIFGLKNMAHPRTAVRGNLMGATGMLLAVVVAVGTAFGYIFIAVGLLIGGAIGITLALVVEGKHLPQLVALLNGSGGLASVFVAGGALLATAGAVSNWEVLLATALSGIIGAVTFSGSLLAVAKLQEPPIIKKPFPVPAHQLVNAALAGTLVLLAAAMTAGYGWTFLLIALLSLVLGVLLVNPIGGADMPVVIALLNSYSGLAAAATGFVIDNNVLIISGSLVGASGIILTKLMCKAMNRSLTNVLFATMDTSKVTQDADEVYANVRSTSAEDVAMLLETAQRVVFAPGYGMAVVQAQHAVRDLGNLLETRGAEVEYAIHPVAGRMPGHMNVLLAEADIDYDKLKEMDLINPTMETVDVAIVIGANDVVNPMARTDPHCPIAGMPILDVDKARTVIVIKRSLSPGFAGIPNPLFAADNTLMLYGDGRQAILEILAALKEA